VSGESGIQPYSYSNCVLCVCPHRPYVASEAFNAAHAEAVAKNQPLMDIKFLGSDHCSSDTANESQEGMSCAELFATLAEHGIATTTMDRMDVSDLADYKYHIDLGGGGGTSWSGMPAKLAMPVG
jgi:hypothetical protein